MRRRAIQSRGDREVSTNEPREYRTDQIAVSFDPAICIHTGRCLRGLPQVFDLEARPWIQPEHATAEDVIEVINRCPSGALQWRMLDGNQEDEVATETPALRLTRDGPIYVRGNVGITGADGEALTHSHRVALCRCGHSANKPFCDNSHREAGWKAG
jgi:uncharacterized Fe-S cluster protein YjdI